MTHMKTTGSQCTHPKEELKKSLTLPLSEVEPSAQTANFTLSLPPPPLLVFYFILKESSSASLCSSLGFGFVVCAAKTVLLHKKNNCFTTEASSSLSYWNSSSFACQNCGGRHLKNQLKKYLAETKKTHYICQTDFFITSLWYISNWHEKQFITHIKKNQI